MCSPKILNVDCALSDGWRRLLVNYLSDVKRAAERWVLRRFKLLSPRNVKHRRFYRASSKYYVSRL